MEYRGIVGYNELKKMARSKLMGFDQGIIVELKKEDEEPIEENKSSPMLQNSRGNIELNQAITAEDPDYINCVLEKQLGPGCLFDTGYNNFGLR